MVQLEADGKVAAEMVGCRGAEVQGCRGAGGQGSTWAVGCMCKGDHITSFFIPSLLRNYSLEPEGRPADHLASTSYYRASFFSCIHHSTSLCITIVNFSSLYPLMHHQCSSKKEHAVILALLTLVVFFVKFIYIDSFVNVE